MGFTDWEALDAMAAALDAGLRVPEDVSVVGFADLRVSASVRPRLTTVAQDPVEIGRRAAARLVERLAGRPGALPGVAGNGVGEGGAKSPPPPASASLLVDRVPVRMEVRESTGAPTEAGSR
jgi:hypothetical protein